MGRRHKRHLRFRARRALIFACVAAACRDSTGSGPRAHAHRLLLPGTDEGAAVVVDLDRGAIVRTLGPRFVRQGPSVLTPEGQLITAGRLENGQSILLGIDSRTGGELWRIPIAQGNEPIPVEGVELGTTAIARHAARPEVFLWRSERFGQPGIAVFDYSTQRITGFLEMPTNRVRAIAVARPDVQHPEGCVVAAADGASGQQTRAYLLFFCGPSYAAQDSMALAPPTQVVSQLELTPGGQDLVLGSNSEMLVVDPALRQVRWRASRPLPSPFFASAAGGRYFLADAGTLTVSSSGIIYALDSTLELSAVVDLRTALGDERPLGVLGGATSQDGRWLYLVGGVGRDGPAYGPEQTSLVILELATGEVKALLRLGTVGGARPYLVP
ncbi:MAG TPA: hypothetical protein VLE53_10970 [Gemmatimonadaceae bacterium]|nr:hypothetical protein [Gemmatimonadaceae bacterium]